MPTNNLKTCIIAVPVITGNVQENLNFVERKLGALDSGTQLVVVPELFTTNFIPNSDVIAKLAEPIDGHTMTTVMNWAARHDIAICGSFLSTDGNGKYFNRGFIVLPTGETSFYDKRHLFRLGGEHDLLTPGKKESPVVNFKSWNLKMSICYDIRFPVWNRAVNCDYDCLLVPANWPDARSYAWRQLLIARAIENQTYVVGANRTGTDGSGNYALSELLIYNNWGKEISQCDDTNEIVTATLDGERLSIDRKRFPVWLDEDDFKISL